MLAWVGRIADRRLWVLGFVAAVFVGRCVWLVGICIKSFILCICRDYETWPPVGLLSEGAYSFHLCVVQSEMCRAHPNRWNRS